MKWLNIIGSLLQCLIPFLGYIGKVKAAKEVEILATGVERFAKAETSSGKGKAIKDTIRAVALDTGIERRLKKKIKKFETRLWKKVF